MAYVFGFPKEVTNLIYDMRDWKLEDVKQNNGTPSCLALKPFSIWPQPFPVPNNYKIIVHPKNRRNKEVWIVALFGLGFRKHIGAFGKTTTLTKIMIMTAGMEHMFSLAYTIIHTIPIYISLKIFSHFSTSHGVYLLPFRQLV